MKIPLIDKNSGKEFISGRRCSLKYFEGLEMLRIDEKILEAECPRYFADISHENSRKFSVMNCCLISQQRLLV